MKKTDEHQQAQSLYFQTHLSQAQIARILNVDRKSVSNWIAEGNWRQQKKLAAHIPAKIAEQWYYMLANMNYDILSREGQPWPMVQEVAQLKNMTLCIKNIKNRQTINESMEAYTHLAERINQKDPELAEKLKPHIQEFITERACVKFADLVDESMNINPKVDEMFPYEIRPEDDDIDIGGIPETPAAGPSAGPAPAAGLQAEESEAGARSKELIVAGASAEAQKASSTQNCRIGATVSIAKSTAQKTAPPDNGSSDPDELDAPAMVQQKTPPGPKPISARAIPRHLEAA